MRDRVRSKMPFVNSFEDFALQCKLIFNDDALRTRYQVKYRHQEKEVILKVTDDKHVSNDGVRCAAHAPLSF
jgi:hypothetical protein